MEENTRAASDKTSKSSIQPASDGFTAEGRAAKGSRKPYGTADVLEKIAAMVDADRVIALRLREIITKAAPGLTPKTRYGMPAYARDGKVVCFFQDAAKFKARYATLGFRDAANLNDGTTWPTSFALTKLTPAVEKQIVALVKKATD